MTKMSHGTRARDSRARIATMKPKAAANGACAVGHDFMQRAAGEAALRQMGIKRGKAEGQGFVADDLARPAPRRRDVAGGAIPPSTAARFCAGAADEP